MDEFKRNIELVYQYLSEHEIKDYYEERHTLDNFAKKHLSRELSQEHELLVGALMSEVSKQYFLEGWIACMKHCRDMAKYMT